MISPIFDCPFLEALFKLFPMYPISIPATGNKITTNSVSSGLITINVIRNINILIGSLKIISITPIIDHSISTKSDVILDVKSPFFCSVKYAKGSEIIFS